MTFTCRTEYTRRELATFSRYHTPIRSAVTYVLVGMATATLALAFLLAMTDSGASVKLINSLCRCGVVLVILSFGMYCLGNLLVRRQFGRQLICDITFTEDCIGARSRDMRAGTSGTFLYSAVRKVTASASAYYLCFQPNNAFLIVSKSGFSQGSSEEFVAFLRTKLPSEKIKIK